MSHRWLGRELVEEAWRRAGPGVLVLLLGGCMSLVAQVVVCAITLDSAYRQRRIEEAAGSEVWTIGVDQKASLEAADCERLHARSPAILASGALIDGQQRPPFTLAATGREVPTVDLTPGALAVWAPEVTWSEAPLLGRDLAAVERLEPGVTLRSAGRLVGVRALLPMSVAPAELQAAVVRLSPPRGPTHLCWVKMDAAVAPGIVDPLLRSQFTHQFVAVKPFRSPDPLRKSPVDLVSESPWLYVGGGLAVLGLLGLLAAWIDRREIGVYQLTGTSRSDLTVMWLIQLTGVLGLAWTVASIAILAALVFSDVLPADSGVVWYLAYPSLVTVLGAPVVMSSGYIGLLRVPIVEKLRQR